MANYTLEDIMCGDKYNIESAVFMEAFRLVEQKVDAKTIREQLNTIYVSGLSFALKGALLVKGSLQIKNNKYYAVFRVQGKQK